MIFKLQVNYLTIRRNCKRRPNKLFHKLNLSMENHLVLRDCINLSTMGVISTQCAEICVKQDARAQTFGWLILYFSRQACTLPNLKSVIWAWSPMVSHGNPWFPSPGCTLPSPQSVVWTWFPMISRGLLVRSVHFWVPNP